MSKVLVKTIHGTIVVPDKFIVYDSHSEKNKEFNTYPEAQEALIKESTKQLDAWLNDNTYITSCNRETLINDLIKLEDDSIETFIKLVENLKNAKF